MSATPTTNAAPEKSKEQILFERAKEKQLEAVIAVFGKDVSKGTESKHTDYVRYAQVNGETWISLRERVSRHTIASLVAGENRIDALRNAVDYMDDEGRDFLFVRVNQFSTEARFVDLLVACAERDDGDVTDAVDTISELIEVPPGAGEWPEDPEAPLAFGEAMLLLHSAARTKTPLLVIGSDSLVVPSRVQIGHSMFGRYISIEARDARVCYGEKLAKCQMYFRVPEHANLCLADLPMRQASQKKMDEIVARNKVIVNAFRENKGNMHRQFNGVGYESGFWGSRLKFQVDSRVVFDTEGAFKQNHGNASGLLNLFNLDLQTRDDDSTDYDDGSPELAIAQLQPLALFYDLSAGRWRVGRFDDSREIAFRENAFDQLVLDDGRKRLIKALTSHHAKSSNVDIIDNKGGGAIFMLDGAPGTGKTLTAEATAEVQKRVLYKVGLGDLGTSPDQLEKALQRILGLAARWDAVLLIDEADVFMEKRDANNIQRNALVAVFLRLLEYYNGIMFLTTNRGNNFDPAFRSRVTLAIHYKRPTQEGRFTIWTNLLKNRGLEFSTAEIEALASVDINGREIKNAINSAGALAAEDGLEVNVSHIREILECQATFDKEVKAERE